LSAAALDAAQKKEEHVKQVAAQKLKKEQDAASSAILHDLYGKHKTIIDAELHYLSTENNNAFNDTIQKRVQALEESIANPTATMQRYVMKDLTAGFMLANDLDRQQFQKVDGLSIQHQLTQELLDVLDAIADFALQHPHQALQQHLANYCANVSSLTQQANQRHEIPIAVQGTNCCHSIEHYLKGMVSGVEQAYQHFQTAVRYLQPTLEEYALIIEQHALQGVAIGYGLEAMATAGMIAAPTVTVAATGIIIAVTAYVMAPLCAQAMIDTVAFGGACITGNWGKVGNDLDNFGKFISSRETVARMAEFAGTAAVPTPNLSCVVDKIFSLRPVITSVQNTSGEMVQSLYLMSKNQLQKVYAQGVELLQLPEFVNFNMSYKKICDLIFLIFYPRVIRHLQE